MIDIDRLNNQLTTDNIPIAMRAVITLLWQSGGRVSDILNVTEKDITEQGFISIHQSKGSNYITLQPIYYRNYWLSLKGSTLPPGKVYNRFHVYRLLKKYNITYRRKGRVNNAVTHAFRHNLAKELQHIDSTKKRAQDGLGHRSKRSTDSYTN